MASSKTISMPASAGAGASTSDGASIKIYESFDDMGLNRKIHRGICSFGYSNPSGIQQKAIVPMMSGCDMLVQSQSGTGKTGTFIIGGLSRINTSLNVIQMIILCPTRELATQTAYVATQIAQYTDARIFMTAGKDSMKTVISTLVQHPSDPVMHIPHVLVITPGRLFDIVSRDLIDRSQMRVMVLDEADQLLDGKFKDQIREIMRVDGGWPATMQICLFSATMIPEIECTAKRILRPDYLSLLIEAEKVTLEGIDQYYVNVNSEAEKLETVIDLYNECGIAQAVIFVNTKEKTEWLANSMSARGFNVGCIHGGMSVEERNHCMEDFRRSKIRVLISTDLIGRGIDVQSISVVINYELPMDRENYIHRIGRSGRFGRKGVSINLVLPVERRMQSDIVSYYSREIRELPYDVASILRF